MTRGLIACVLVAAFLVTSLSQGAEMWESDIPASPPCHHHHHHLLLTGDDLAPRGCSRIHYPGPSVSSGRVEGLPNPERGFYKYSETASSDWLPLEPSLLQAWLDQGFSLVFRYVVLDTFVNSDITDDILQKIGEDFVTLREVGVKTVLRFCYSVDVNNIEDAPPTQLKRHLQQLSPLFHEHAGVIAVLQAGFIGVWGEWYYTANYGNQGNISPEDWDKRARVVDELLLALPPSRQIHLRTPYYKRTILGRTDAITEEEAFQDTPVARIGQHNDCFLASDTDFGTYQNKTEEYPYLQQETLYLAIGGETCGYNPPRSDCPTALKEMEELHYRYLNSQYHPDVLSSWQIQGCYDQIWSSMGYRLVGQSAQVPSEVQVGGTVSVAVQVANQGWGAPINYRTALLVLHHVPSGVEFISAPANEDLRFWLPGQQHVLQLSLTLSDSAPLGQYKVLVSLPDGDPQLQDLAAFNIVMENLVDAEEPDRRLNLIGYLSVV